MQSGSILSKDPGIHNKVCTINLYKEQNSSFFFFFNSNFLKPNKVKGISTLLGQAEWEVRGRKMLWDSSLMNPICYIQYIHPPFVITQSVRVTACKVTDQFQLPRFLPTPHAIAGSRIEGFKVSMEVSFREQEAVFQWSLDKLFVIAGRETTRTPTATQPQLWNTPRHSCSCPTFFSKTITLQPFLIFLIPK